MLWILQPVRSEDMTGDDPWSPWFDKAFGFVVRAETEEQARALAAEQAGDEGPAPWLSQGYTSCTELERYGETEVIMRDFQAA